MPKMTLSEETFKPFEKVVLSALAGNPTNSTIVLDVTSLNHRGTDEVSEFASQLIRERGYELAYYNEDHYYSGQGHTFAFHVNRGSQNA